MERYHRGFSSYTRGGEGGGSRGGHSYGVRTAEKDVSATQDLQPTQQQQHPHHPHSQSQQQQRSSSRRGGAGDEQLLQQHQQQQLRTLDSHDEEEDTRETEEAVGKPRVVELLEDVSVSSLQSARALVETLRDGSGEGSSSAVGGGDEERKKLDANSAYLICFQLLKQAGLEAELPRLVVFGQQSMGKTTLLDYIMGGPVGYSSTDTGTRQPVVIMLRPSETGEAECRVAGERVELRELQQRMQRIMAAQGDRISSEELEVELAVKNGVHAVFVDLPGIKDDSKAGAMQTRAVVKTYVQQNPNDLYILVKKASDDPANWPWSLREFILSPPPPGLGLSSRQTVVVGTRAKEFLINERNDIRTQSQLLERVLKRAVKDSSGEPFPLYLLELFSLSMEEKDTLDFAAKRAAMNRQMEEGGRAVKELLLHAFEPGANAQQTRRLAEFFSPTRFKRELNRKFQGLLSEQLAALERRLVRKRLATERRIAELEEQLSQQNPQSCREFIKLYLRELMQVVTELVSGNYTIIRLPESGDVFLSNFGGSLRDNLEDGHRLACELFPEKDHYDPDFLAKTYREAEEIFRRQDFEERFAPRTGPDGRVIMQPGQIVRYTLSKDESNMFGLVQSVGFSSSSQAAAAGGGVSGASSSPPPAAAGLALPPAPGAAAAPPAASAAAAAGSAAGGSASPPPPGQPPGGAAAAGETAAAAAERLAAVKNSSGGGGGGIPLLGAKDATVTFYFRSGPTQGEQCQFKTVDRQRLTVLVPLQAVMQPNAPPPPAGFRCWRRFYRPDGWVGLQPVELQSVSLPAVQQQQHLLHQTPWTAGAAAAAGGPLLNGDLSETGGGAAAAAGGVATAAPPPEGGAAAAGGGGGGGATAGGGGLHALQQQGAAGSSSSSRSYLFDRGEAVVKCLLGPDLRSVLSPHAPDQVVAIDELFTDAAAEIPDRSSSHAGGRRGGNLTTMQRISGDFAEMKLLNQLALTHLGRWLKFHMCNMEPERKFSDHVLLQMMRSVRHVIDKADWEPLVADLLQANVRGGLLQLVRLAACAAAAALRRILRAASAEVLRQVRNGDLTGGLLFLVNNRRFMEELNLALENYCRKRARECATAMRDLVFEQTHAIHFEMIEDFFDGCRRFETDFLGGSMMLEVTQHVKDSLAMRKQRLGIADAYARHDSGAAGTPNSMIYEEVRIQFWVVKMLLSAPLTTKLYMHFIKDIKDKSMHLASEEKHTITCESDLERTLQERMLSEPSPTGRALPRTDEELMEHFNIDLNKDELMVKLQAARRTEEYTKLALEGVGKLLQLLQKGRGVDFLARLEEASTGRPFAASANSESLSSSSRKILNEETSLRGGRAAHHPRSAGAAAYPLLGGAADPAARGGTTAAAAARGGSGPAAAATGGAAAAGDRGTGEYSAEGGPAAADRIAPAAESQGPGGGAGGGSTGYHDRGSSKHPYRPTAPQDAAAVGHVSPPLNSGAAAPPLRNLYLLNNMAAAAAAPKAANAADQTEEKDHLMARRLPSIASTTSANGA